MPNDPKKFVIYFEVPEAVFEILRRLGQEHKQSPGDVARHILQSWMMQVTDATQGVDAEPPPDASQQIILS
jgi:hypothetical protein